MRAEALHVDVGGRERVPRLVLHAGRVAEALAQRRLLPQRLRQRRVRQRAARVQPLSERVHHADLPRAAPLVAAARRAALAGVAPLRPARPGRV